ncbi:MAG: family 16 glycoside hydrolase [Verrucomicrobiales bacterium]
MTTRDRTPASTSPPNTRRTAGRKGYEARSTTPTATKKTAGKLLYAVKDNFEGFKDDEWMDYHIKVEGKHIVISINGKGVTDYTEPENPEHLKQMPGNKLAPGTIAFQARPEEQVFYKDIQLKGSAKD